MNKWSAVVKRLEEINRQQKQLEEEKNMLGCKILLEGDRVEVIKLLLEMIAAQDEEIARLKDRGKQK